MVEIFSHECSKTMKKKENYLPITLIYSLTAEQRIVNQIGINKTYKGLSLFCFFNKLSNLNTHTYICTHPQNKYSKTFFDYKNT